MLLLFKINSLEQLIASYLFQNKSCPLPAIGKLTVNEKPAVVSHGAKIIEAPQQHIDLVKGEYSTDDFLNYIGAVAKIGKDEARARLHNFCKQLQSLDSFAETKIPHTGKFYVNAEGNLVFKHKSYPSQFLDAVAAEKVIHPDSSHALLVGDTESNTTLMTEYFNVDDPAPRQRWWIAALLLALIGLAVISLYYVNESDAGAFGNATKTPLREAPQTYSTPK